MRTELNATTEGQDPSAAALSGGTVVVGASEKTLWSHWLVTNLRDYNPDTPLWVINPQQDSVHGIPALKAIADLPTVPSIGVVMLRADRCVDVVRELVALGTSDIVVVSTGFQESRTDEGAAYQGALIEAVQGTATRLIGPNCVGFADLTNGICAVSEPLPQMHAGTVSVISQSGGLLASCIGAIAAHQVGLDKCYSIGNGAAFGVHDALAELAANDTTDTICAVLESITDAAAFEAAAIDARERGKNIVAVKIGRSAQARSVAVSHTGAAVGDDAAIDAWFRRLGVYRVDSINEAGALVSLLDWLDVATLDSRTGVFIATGSGGGCGVAADLADRAGVRLAQLAEDSVARLRELLPAGAYIGNPLDVTGAATDPNGLTAYDHIMTDPKVGLILQPMTIPWPDDSDGRRWHRASFEAITEAAEKSRTPLIPVSFYQQHRTAWITGQSMGWVNVHDQLEAVVGALAALFPRIDAPVAEAVGAQPKRDVEVLSELPGRKVLAEAGLPLVPGGWAADAERVVELGRTLPGPWVVKVASDTIEHKARVGGVQIGIVDEAGLRAAAQAIQAGLDKHGVSDRADGFLVQQMVFGQEVLVGCLTDADGRRTLNIGVGGWAAEAFPDIKTLLLPLANGELQQVIERSSFGRLLSAANRAALVSVVGDIAISFVSGPLQRFQTVEINPVILTPTGPMIADALLVAH